MADKQTPSLRSHFRTRNRALAREIEAVARAADLPSTILILGESGTGKDRLARAIHDVSSRASSPFVRVDAANLSDELFESELFGHERGAFTGAFAAKRGLLEVAEGGTVYLDEASSLSPGAQAKFLRVLQEKNFRRLAGVTTHPFHARLIVSSRRDLASLVEQGAFRDDFFYRIDVVSLRLPRLAERREDVLPLAREFLRRAARAYERPARKFSKGAEQSLLRHPWPGNVRELLHVVEKAVLTAESAEIGPQDLPAGALGAPESLLASAGENRWSLRELTNAYIEETVRRAGGKPIAGREEARSLPEVSVGKKQEITPRTPLLSLGSHWTASADRLSSATRKISPFEPGGGARKKESHECPRQRPKPPG